LTEDFDEAVDEAFFRRKIAEAVNLRRNTLNLDAVTDAWRVVHSEGDGLSGLVVDRYGDLLVQRQLAAQLEGRTPLDADALGQLLTELEAPIRQGLQISREDQRHWQQVWFEQNPQPEWQGLFLRWLRPQDRLGLVHVEDLAMDLAAECPAGSEPADPLLLRVLQPGLELPEWSLLATVSALFLWGFSAREPDPDPPAG
jgi:hypothetical protein